MPRAYFIYVLMYSSPVSDKTRTVGAWTVKHELLSWVEKHIDPVDGVDQYYILAYHDSAPSKPARVIFLDDRAALEG